MVHVNVTIASGPCPACHSLATRPFDTTPYTLIRTNGRSLFFALGAFPQCHVKGLQDARLSSAIADAQSVCFARLPARENQTRVQSNAWRAYISTICFAIGLTSLWAGFYGIFSLPGFHINGMGDRSPLLYK